MGEATTEKSQDELRSSEETGRGRPGYEEASGDATTNTVDLPHPSSTPSFQSSSLCPSGETKPIGSGADRSVSGEKEEELGRGRPSYEEASRDATTNEETPDGASTNGASTACKRGHYERGSLKRHYERGGGRALLPNEANPGRRGRRKHLPERARRNKANRPQGIAGRPPARGHGGAHGVSI